MSTFHPCLNGIAERLASVQKALHDGKLSESQGRYLSENYAFVYKDGPTPTLAMGRSGSAQPEKTKEYTDKYTVPFIVSVQLEDRDGDVVRSRGVQYRNFSKSPGVFFGHQEWEIPIGQARSVAGEILFSTDDTQVKSACRFDEHDSDAMLVYQKVMGGFINSSSLAFVPIQAWRRDRNEEKGAGSDWHKAKPHRDPEGGSGWWFEDSDATEWSIVGVGSNPGALRDIYDQEKSYMSLKLQKGWKTYCAKSVNESGGCFVALDGTMWCPRIEKQATKKSVKMTVEVKGDINDHSVHVINDDGTVTHIEGSTAPLFTESLKAIQEKLKKGLEKESCGCKDCKDHKPCPCGDHKSAYGLAASKEDKPMNITSKGEGMGITQHKDGDRDWGPKRDWSTAFPDFVKPADHDKVSHELSSELQAWRNAGKEHYDMDSPSARLRHRGKLEAAFNALKNAYKRISQVKSNKKLIKKDTSTAPVALQKYTTKCSCGRPSYLDQTKKSQQKFGSAAVPHCPNCEKMCNECSCAPVSRDTTLHKNAGTMTGGGTDIDHPDTDSQPLTKATNQADMESCRGQAGEIDRTKSSTKTVRYVSAAQGTDVESPDEEGWYVYENGQMVDGPYDSKAEADKEFIKVKSYRSVRKSDNRLKWAEIPSPADHGHGVWHEGYKAWVAGNGRYRIAKIPNKRREQYQLSVDSMFKHEGVSLEECKQEAQLLYDKELDRKKRETEAPSGPLPPLTGLVWQKITDGSYEVHPNASKYVKGEIESINSGPAKGTWKYTLHIRRAEHDWLGTGKQGYKTVEEAINAANLQYVEEARKIASFYRKSSLNHRKDLNTISGTQGGYTVPVEQKESTHDYVSGYMINYMSAGSSWYWSTSDPRLTGISNGKRGPFSSRDNAHRDAARVIAREKYGSKDPADREAEDRYQRLDRAAYRSLKTGDSMKTLTKAGRPVGTDKNGQVIGHGDRVETPQGVGVADSRDAYDKIVVILDGSHEEIHVPASSCTYSKNQRGAKQMKTLTRYLVKTAKGYVTKDKDTYTDDDDDAQQFEDPSEAQAKADEENVDKPDDPDAQVEEVEVEDPENADKDTNEGAPSETEKDESTSGEEAFTPKPSAKHAAMLHANANDEDQYITNALKDMDHPGMSQDLEKYREKFVTPRKEHLAGILHKHHGDEGSDPASFMDKVSKAMETDGAGATSETGEAQLVDQGQIPADDAPPGPDAPVPDADTEEISERYQDKKTKKWFTKTVGTVRRGLNGRLYIVKDWSPAAREAEQDALADARPKKSIDDEDVEAVKDAGDYMNDASDDDQVPKGHRSAMKSHAKRLGQVHKSLTNMGKVQADGGRGSTLTDEGTAGNKRAMTDKGETQTDHKTPSGSPSWEGGTGDVLTLKDWEVDIIKSMETLQEEKDDMRKVGRWIGMFD